MSVESIPIITAAREAMATRFEVALHGDDPTRLRAAAGEALEEIARLEGMLSLFEPTSEIAHCNARFGTGLFIKVSDLKRNGLVRLAS